MERIRTCTSNRHVIHHHVYRMERKTDVNGISTGSLTYQRERCQGLPCSLRRQRLERRLGPGKPLVSRDPRMDARGGAGRGRTVFGWMPTGGGSIGGWRRGCARGVLWTWRLGCGSRRVWVLNRGFRRKDCLESRVVPLRPRYSASARRAAHGGRHARRPLS